MADDDDCPIAWPSSARHPYPDDGRVRLFRVYYRRSADGRLASMVPRQLVSKCMRYNVVCYGDDERRLRVLARLPRSESACELWNVARWYCYTHAHEFLLDRPVAVWRDVYERHRRADRGVDTGAQTR